MTLMTQRSTDIVPTDADVCTKENKPADVSFEARLADSKLAVIQSMIKQIRNGTPIYRLQLPIFLLEPRSLLDKYSDLCNHLDYILQIPSLDDPLQRFLGVVQFYLSGWYTRTKDIRNPFNPVIGEVFRCHYDHGDSTTYYIAEQISHHPPSTAFCCVNEAKGLSVNSYLRPVVHFRGNSLDIDLQGKLVGHLSTRNEDYIGNFPNVLVRNVVVGQLQITLCGASRLSCPQSGYYCDFDFKTKGLLKGKHNYVVAQVKHTSNKKKVFCTIEGRWDDRLTISAPGEQERVFLDISTAPLSRPIIPPETEQAENESRRVWGKVIDNILDDNEEVALQEKTKVEENQRALDRERKANGVVWVPKLFEQVEDDYYVHKTLRSPNGLGKGAN